jgi:hypothetical protein
MLRKSTPLVLACVLLPPLPACYRDLGPKTEDTTTADEPDPEIVMRCNEGATRKRTIAEALCRCQVDQGLFTSVAACLGPTGDAATLDACACDIHGEFPETRDDLECLAPAQTTVLACLEGVTCTPDTAAFDACINPYYNAISTCGVPTKPLLSEVALRCEMVAPFACGSGETIPETWKCDLSPDCQDASDESTCAGTFMCADGTAYIEEALRCDLFDDCQDGSDEQNCPTFTCVNGTVIPLLYRCDTISDCCGEDADVCADQSDELNCPTFMCADGMTIPLAFRCDDFDDCTDGTDELGCPAP